MIIFKDTKLFQTRSDKPNENWLEGADVFVVEDETELAEKIEKHAPYYNFVLDMNNELIDITPTERPPEPPKEPTEIELLQRDMGVLLMESANDKARIAEIETLTGDLILEIANLKAGGAA